MANGIAGLQPDQNGFYHPASVDDVKKLILHANQNGLEVRVRGSAHSVNASIYTDGFGTSSSTGIDMLLDKMRAVTFDDANQQVTVEAGCNLGKDPYDPSGTSTWENSLLNQVNKKGWALPDLGGIDHQTVGGFISTGSSGGSVKYGFDEQIISLEIVDGSGNVHEITKANNPDLFYAAGVSMGLLGVVTKVTLQCIDDFNITGQQVNSTYDGCAIDLFGPGGNGKPSLQQFLTDTEYTRLMWWPQQGAERMQVWQASRLAPTPDFKPKPYEEFPPVLGTELPAEILAGLFYTLVGKWPDWLHEILGNGLEYNILKTALQAVYPTMILPWVINEFVPVTGSSATQDFQDYWYSGLPMDNEVDDKVFPTKFTEIWIPISQTEAVMNAMLQHYREGGKPATGSYSCEVYAAKSSDFWMSPSYGQDVVRIDVFWFGYNNGNPVDYYNQFWQLLKPFDFRLHWGKYLPDDTDGTWAKYLSQQYPHWEDFMKIREQMDPKQIFVTSYWREHLGIPPVGQ